jgi:hypothetical protein
MANIHALSRALRGALSSLLSLAALTVACDVPDSSASGDDSQTEFDAGASQIWSPPSLPQVDVDANSSRSLGSVFSQVDASSGVLPSTPPTTPEGGASPDSTSSTATFEGGVTVTVAHVSGTPDGATGTRDASADTSSTTSGAADGGSCASGPCQPVVIASGLTDAVGLAVDGSNVYFSAGGVVYECPADGCGNTPVPLADYQDAIGAITVDATTVYWTTADSVMACDIGGCGDMPTALATDLANPWGIAVDSTRVYWAAYDDGTVGWLPLAGGTGTTIQGGTSPQYVAVDSERVYFTDVGDGISGSVSAWAGGTRSPDVLATGPSPNGIATDGSSVFWTAGSASTPGATVSGCAVGGCNGTPDVLDSDPGTPQRIAVDASGIYWANGDVYVLRPGSSTPVALTSGQSATDIAIDDVSVYWIDVGATEDCVRRVAK